MNALYAPTRTTAPTSRSPAMGSYRTYDADGTSLRWRSRRTGGWRSRSTNWPWRSDRGPTAGVSMLAPTRRNRARRRVRRPSDATPAAGCRWPYDAALEQVHGQVVGRWQPEGGLG